MNGPPPSAILVDLVADAETAAAIGWLGRCDRESARALVAFATVVGRAACRLETRPSSAVAHALRVALSRWVEARRRLVGAYRDAASRRAPQYRPD